MLSVQTSQYSSLRFVGFMMNCAGDVEREDSLSFVFLIFTVSFPRLKRKKKVNQKCMRLRISKLTWYITIGNIRKFYLKIGF